MARHGVDPSRLPVAILCDGRVLVDPANVDLAETPGVRPQPEPTTYGVVIVEAGPAEQAALHLAKFVACVAILSWPAYTARPRQSRCANRA